MTNQEIIERIRKLSYHVSILGQAIDYDKHPVEALILSMDWRAQDLETAHDIFERWDERLEKGETMEKYKFEGDFEKELGITYQGLKSIILAFYESSKWTNVCEAYVDIFGATPPIEYKSIMNRRR
ncbi:DUF1878 family protein [Parasedimentitalea marina]|uniref:DUF1878 family protein n=1 Tax=Parasedimentitalea marina TaxID=2483033 RepID=A0A3T0N102_9RHOB|nr:DUF1878 family protein [Parasedimentitalea marina]AZV77700.1 DUF1878 family protein [Parasedimentitalea marina]